MSSTNRGGVRADADFYPTPAWVVDRLLERLELPGGRWLEPSAGDGAIIKAVNARRSDVQWTAVELREGSRHALAETGAEVVIDDFLHLSPRWLERLFGVTSFDAITRRFDVAPLNPPFSSALEFVRRCLQCAGEVIALERLNWLESAERHPFFREYMPDVYVVGRVDFDGRGGDSIPYAWFHWPAAGENGDRRRGRGAIELLDLTPSTEKVRGELPPTIQPGLFG